MSSSAGTGSALDVESPGDSLATGDSEGSLDGDADGDAEGLADGEGPFWPPLPPEVGDELGEGALDPLPPLVGEGDGVLVGEDVVGVAVGVLGATGGATLGGTAPPAGRSCCHDHPTEPPARTVRAPAPEDANVHEAFDPSAHQRPQ